MRGALSAIVSLSLLLAAQCFAAALTRGPALQLADATGITVTFNTELPSIGQVHFGAMPGPLGSTASELVPTDTLGAVVLELDYDDGFVAFLNGVEIARQNVARAQLNTTLASASRASGLVEHRLVASPGLAIGDNVLAIEVHNVSAASSDLFLSARLRCRG